MRTRAIPTRTLENLAAAEALGLSYWSEAPRPSHLWALDADRRPHEVKVDRRRGTTFHREQCQLGCVLDTELAHWTVTS